MKARKRIPAIDTLHAFTRKPALAIFVLALRFPPTILPLVAVCAVSTSIVQIGRGRNRPAFNDSCISLW